MPSFEYVGTSDAGAHAAGLIIAADEVRATSQLIDRGIWPLSVRSTRYSRRRLTGKAKAQTRAVVDALATLLNARFSVRRALASAYLVTPRNAHASIAALDTAIRTGESVTSAIATMPGLGATHQAIIGAGEAAGDLAGAFARLSSQLADEDQIRSRIRSATLYPAILVGAGGSTLMLLLAFIVPRFERMLTEAGASVPLALVALSYVGRWFPIAAGVLVVTTLICWRLSPNTAIAVLVRIAPSVSAMGRLMVTRQLAKLLSVLLKSGMPLERALREIGTSCGDDRLRQIASHLHRAVCAGERLSTAMETTKRLDPLAVQVVSLGEESGQIMECLERAAHLLENRINERLQRFVVLIEPVVVLVMGLVVGIVAAVLFKAVYALSVVPA